MKKLNESGTTLVEVLLAGALLSAVAMGISTFINSSNKEVKALTEKLITKDIETSLANVFQNNEFCDCMFKGKEFDTTDLTKPWTGISSVPIGFADTTTCAPNPAFIVPPPGQKVPGSNVKVLKMAMIKLVHVGGDDYTGDLTVKFDSSDMVRDTRNVKTNIAFTIDSSAGSPSARPFKSCKGGIGKEIEVVKGPWNKGPSQMTCPVGMKIMNCFVETQTSNGDSFHYQQKITFLPSDTNPTGCQNNSSDSSDTGRVVLICMGN